MRNRDLDPTVARELAELEAALAGSPEADPALATLVSEVRDSRSEPDPAFTARMEQQVARGFPDAEPNKGVARATTLFGSPASKGWWPPRLRVAAPLGAVALAASVAAIALTSANHDRAITSSDVSESAAVKPSQAAPSSRGESQSKADGATGDNSVGASPEVAPLIAGPQPTPEVTTGARKVERTAAMALSAKRGKLQDTSDRVIAVTTRVGGYVASSTMSVRGNGGTADLRLRVPSEKLDASLKALAKLGHVRSLDQAEQDITGTFGAAAARLDEARAERRGLLSALGKAGSDGQIARLKARLRENRARMAAADAALTAVRSRAARATIDVHLMTESASAAADEPGRQGFGLEAAASASLKLLSASAGVLLLILAAGVPVLALTLIGLLALRSVRKRGRERALDSPADATIR